MMYDGSAMLSAVVVRSRVGGAAIIWRGAARPTSGVGGGCVGNTAPRRASAAVAGAPPGVRADRCCVGTVPSAGAELPAAISNPGASRLVAPATAAGAEALELGRLGIAGCERATPIATGGSTVSGGTAPGSAMAGAVLIEGRASVFGISGRAMSSPRPATPRGGVAAVVVAIAAPGGASAIGML